MLFYVFIFKGYFNNDFSFGLDNLNIFLLFNSCFEDFLKSINSFYLLVY